MVKAINVGDLIVRPSAKAAGFLKVSDDPFILRTYPPPPLYGNFEIPIMIVNGSKPGPVLSLTAGHHGCEYCGIQAAIDTYTNTDPEELSGSIIILPIVNIEGFKQTTMYVNPIDGFDICGVYSSKEKTASVRHYPLSYRIAQTVFEKVASISNHFIDLHGGDYMEAVPPTCFFVKTGKAETDSVEEAMATAYGSDFVMPRDLSPQAKSNSPGSLLNVLSQQGIPSIIEEAGGEGKLDKTIVDLHVKGIKNVMKRFRMLDGEPETNPSQKIMRRWWYIYARNFGIFRPKVKPGDAVSKGQTMGDLENYHGEIIEEFIAPDDGFVFLSMVNPVKAPGHLVFKCFTA